MRILIYGINYYPELTGIGKYTGEMGAWLARHGHEVSVITAMPYYPEWEIKADYQGKGWFTEHIDGVTVYRCPLYVPRKVTSLKRIIHEFTFQLSSWPVWLQLLFHKRFDMVFCIMPPFHIALSPFIYRFFRHTKVIFHIQDLQIDAARNLGMIKNKSLLSLMEKAERFFLKNADQVSTISEGMMHKIHAKGVKPEHTFLFPNWVDSTVVHPLPKEDSLRTAFGLSQQDKILLYSGNLGEKQGLEILIPVAEYFRNEPEVKFVIAGVGGIKEQLVQMVAAHHLEDKILFFPLQPLEKLSSLLAIADAHLVLQKKSASDLVMPSKLTGILSVGGLAIVSAAPGTTLYEVVTQHKMGIIVDPENEEALQNGIREALEKDNTALRTHARTYALNHLSQDAILNDFLKETAS